MLQDEDVIITIPDNVKPPPVTENQAIELAIEALRLQVDNFWPAVRTVDNIGWQQAPRHIKRDCIKRLVLIDAMRALKDMQRVGY